MKINSIYLFKKFIFETKSAVTLLMHELFSIRYFLWIHWIGVIYYQKSTPTSIGSFPIWKLFGSSVSHSHVMTITVRLFIWKKQKQNMIPFFHWFTNWMTSQLLIDDTLYQPTCAFDSFCKHLVLTHTFPNKPMLTLTLTSVYKLLFLVTRMLYERTK